MKLVHPTKLEEKQEFMASVKDVEVVYDEVEAKREMVLDGNPIRVGSFVPRAIVRLTLSIDEGHSNVYTQFIFYKANELVHGSARLPRLNELNATKIQYILIHAGHMDETENTPDMPTDFNEVRAWLMDLVGDQKLPFVVTSKKTQVYEHKDSNGNIFEVAKTFTNIDPVTPACV